MSAQPKDARQNQPAEAVPETAHEKRRHGVERDFDGEVGRAPDHADGRPREPGETTTVVGGRGAGRGRHDSDDPVGPAGFSSTRFSRGW